MSPKSRTSTSKSSKGKDPGRPFAPEVLKEARQIATQYQIIVQHEESEDYWYGHGLELPLAMGGGETAQTCIDDTREALVLSVATSLERGETPPAAAKGGERTKQVNIRLTAEEKAVLTAAAKSRGYKGLGDYMRAKALGSGSA